MPSPIVSRLFRPTCMRLIACVVLLGLFGPGLSLGPLTSNAFGHGAFLDATVVTAVEIQARYDTGEPMVAAQVSIFAPDDPVQPWKVGTTDSQGRYSFVPDARLGRWAIQARQAGHGAMGYVEIRDDMTTVTAGGTGYSQGSDTLQRLLMGASIVWGCIGTALYFRRPRRRSET